PAAAGPGADPDVPRDRRAAGRGAVSGALRTAARLQRPGRVARGARLYGCDARPALGALEARLAAAAASRRADVRRRLPRRLRACAADPARAALARRAQPRGAQPPADVG